MPVTPPDPELEALAREVVHSTAARDPAWATSQGLHEHDDRLLDPRPEAYAVRVQEIRGHLGRLASVPGGGAEVDREALIHALEVEELSLARLRAWEKNPDFALEVLDHLFPLLLRLAEDPPARAAAIASRLAAAPEYFGRARGRIVPHDVPPLWLDVAEESAKEAPAFLDALRSACARSDVPASVQAAVAAGARGAEAALRDHQAWLRERLRPAARGSWALGRALFEELLAARRLATTVRDLEREGEALVLAHRESLRSAALDVLAGAGRSPGPDPVTEALSVARADHPATFEEVLGEYQNSIREAAEFVRSRGLATVPPDAPLDVLETPSYLRHLIPFAAYVPPGRFDPSGRGVYLVTRKDDLGAFCRGDVRNTTVHEAYPGHHLQLSVARGYPSLARVLASAPETIEGWALYCEGLMGRHGYTAQAADRLHREKDALWRALRIVLDVGLHTGTLGFEEAVDRLSAETGMAKAEAIAEARRYTLTPAYNLSYMVGRLAFDRLRGEEEARGGFREREFHDRILRAGSLPFPLLRRAIGTHGRT